MAKFKVGDQVAFMPWYGKGGEVFTIIKIIKTFEGAKINIEGFLVYEDEIELVGPFAKHHTMAREVCGWGS